MKFFLAAALTLAQIGTARPASAAELQSHQPTDSIRVGSFVGARVRVPLGASGQRAHAGLALTSTRRAGETGTLRFSKGLELGLAGDDKVQLSLGGKPVSQLAGQGAGPDGRKLGVSTAGWVAIGVGVVALTVGGIYIWLVSQNEDD
ncbi:MAG TPA: hypothetical protein VEA61_02150 [Allosphingosinicella sp.]|nr:hypothetical protein [Allosphingosinicella sp.]